LLVVRSIWRLPFENLKNAAMLCANAALKYRAARMQTASQTDNRARMARTYVLDHTIQA